MANQKDLQKTTVPKSVPKINKYGLRWGYMYKRGAIWWVKFTDSYGKQKQQSLKTGHMGVAKEKVRLIEQKVKGKVKNTQPVDKITYAFHTSREHFSYTHRANLRYRLQKFISYHKIADISDITKDNVYTFIESIKDKSPNTVKGYYTAISTFCKYLIERGYILDNPCHNIKLPLPHKTPPRYLDDTNYIKALQTARKYSIFLPVYFALKTGCRSAEIRAVQWQDLVWRKNGQNMIIISKSKNKQGRTIPMHPMLARKLKRIRKRSGYIFLGQKGGMVGEKQWREMLKPLQEAIPEFQRNHKGTGTAWHMLRHTFGYRMAAAGVPIPILKEIMGHSDIKTTMIYARLAPNVWYDDIRQA